MKLNYNDDYDALLVFFLPYKGVLSEKNYMQ